MSSLSFLQYWALDQALQHVLQAKQVLKAHHFPTPCLLPPALPPPLLQAAGPIFVIVQEMPLTGTITLPQYPRPQLKCRKILALCAHRTD